MSDIGDWFRSIPAITRYWFAATVAVPLIGKLGIISPAYFFLWPEAFLYRFQIWRPFTATFYFPVGPGTGFLYLVNLYFLYQYSTRLEAGAFDGRPADYLFMLLFNWICIVLHILTSFAVADDSSNHVSTLRLGPAEQRPDCIILVWNTI
ncbi:rCG59470, isoform CRA_b [Rattus norvegicus]|uniref:Derlin n=1 Tax=Rattus norvegicus TaxID=10116 RepID=A6HRI5_RAT|nr:rCG59470, isoform CRA_b [Rattus norvegicus]